LERVQLQNHKNEAKSGLPRRKGTVGMFVNAVGIHIQGDLISKPATHNSKKNLCMLYTENKKLMAVFAFLFYIFSCNIPNA
jgi:hypothetical protein